MGDTRVTLSASNNPSLADKIAKAFGISSDCNHCIIDKVHIQIKFIKFFIDEWAVFESVTIKVPSMKFNDLNEPQSTISVFDGLPQTGTSTDNEHKTVGL